MHSHPEPIPRICSILHVTGAHELKGWSLPQALLSQLRPGSKNFCLSFLLVDHLTAPQTGPWPLDYTKYNTHAQNVNILNKLTAVTEFENWLLDRHQKQPLTPWPLLNPSRSCDYSAYGTPCELPSASGQFKVTRGAPPFQACAVRDTRSCASHHPTHWSKRHWDSSSVGPSTT